MKGTIVSIVIALQMLAPLVLVFLGFRFRRITKRVWMLPVLSIGVGCIILCGVLPAAGFGWLDRQFLRNLRPENVRHFYIGNTMVEEPFRIERITQALHSVEPCLPQDTTKPAASFVVWGKHGGYYWWRMKYWNTEPQDTIVIYFGRGRDSNEPSIFDSYGCSSELASTLRELQIDWDSVP
jgi:hypothetical protein